MKTPYEKCAKERMCIPKSLISLAILVQLLTVSLRSYSQTDPKRTQTIVKEAQDIRYVEEVVNESDGSVQTNKWVEVATGLNYLEDAQWRTTQEEFEELETDFIAIKGPHKLILSKLLSDEITVDLQSPDESRLLAKPSMIYYTSSIGKIPLADLNQRAIGHLVSSNQIVYENAFHNEHLTADLLATYRKSGFEMDLVIREIRTTPSQMGLEEKQARIELCTEIHQSSPITAMNISSNQTEVQRFSLGSMTFVKGVSYGPNKAHEQPVKQELVSEGSRKYFIESVEFGTVAESLNLKKAGANSRQSIRQSELVQNYSQKQGRKLSSAKRAFYDTLKQKQKMRAESSVVGKMIAYTRSNSFTIDYNLVNSTTLLFSGDKTYYVTGPTYLSGGPSQKVIIQGGCVVKFKKSANAKLAINSGAALKLESDLYNPIVLTAEDDGSVGEIVAGNLSSIPMGQYADVALELDGFGRTDKQMITNIRIRNANIAVRGFDFEPNAPLVIRQAQFLDCYQALSTSQSTAKIINALLYGTAYCLNTANSTVILQQVTMHGGAWINQPTSLVKLQNSILFDVSVGSPPSIATDVAQGLYVMTTSSNGNIFESAGAGSHYLPRNSALRHTSNLFIGDEELLDVDSELYSVTTTKPTAFNNDITTDTILSGETTEFEDQRHLGGTQYLYYSTPGYHYPRINYLVNNLYVQGAKLTIQSSCVVAAYGDRGFTIGSNGTVSYEAYRRRFDGSVHGANSAGIAGRNRMCKYNAIQEGLYLGNNTSTFKFFDCTSSTASVKLRGIAASFVADTISRRQIIGFSAGCPQEINVRDCYIFNGTLSETLPPSTGCSFKFINNVFKSCFIQTIPGWQGYSVSLNCELRNNLLLGGELIVGVSNFYPNSATWTVTDNLFERCTFSAYTAGNEVLRHHNGYSIGTLFPIPNIFDVTGVDASTFVTSYSRLYCYPSTGSATSVAALRNVGSRTAKQAGLYHHNTSVLNIEKQNDTVDIGYHNPVDIDSDGDFMPDWMEDTNGDGESQANELSFTSEDTDKDFIPDYDENLPMGPGDVWAFGAGTAAVSKLQVNRSIATDYIYAAAGKSHNAAIRQDGTVVCWGDNSLGQLGVPVGLDKVVDVSARMNHTLVVSEHGAVFAWGANASGQCSVPNGIGYLAVAVAAGGSHSLALLDNGSVVAWGDNSYSQCQVPAGLNQINYISAGLDFSLALRANGTVVAWGRNQYGQCNVPSGLNGVVAISAGWTHACAIKSDGSVVCWGDNAFQGATTPTGLTGVMKLACGSNFCIALKNDGSLVYWGNNAYGQSNYPVNFRFPKGLSCGEKHLLIVPYSEALDSKFDARSDLLVLYSTHSSNTNSAYCKDYYLANRKGVANAAVLGVNVAPFETISDYDFDTIVGAPLIAWYAANPTKRPSHIILMFGIPNRRFGTILCAQTKIKLLSGEPYPIVSSLNMASKSDCVAYIDKLKQVGLLNPLRRVYLSGKAAGINANRVIVDDIRKPDFCAGLGYPTLNSFQLSLSAYIQSGDIINYIGSCNPLTPYTTSANDVAGYFSWGGNGPMTPTFSIDGSVSFTGNSSWSIVTTIESWNGQWFPQEVFQQSYLNWFKSNSFGGIAHSRAAIGGISNVTEPGYLGNVVMHRYFGAWMRGRSLGVAGNVSFRKGDKFGLNQISGDPLVCR